MERESIGFREEEPNKEFIALLMKQTKEVTLLRNLNLLSIHFSFLLQSELMEHKTLVW